MGKPWEVRCAGCGERLGFVFDSAPHQIYCETCAFLPEEPEEEEADEPVS